MNLGPGIEEIITAAERAGIMSLEAKFPEIARRHVDPKPRPNHGVYLEVLRQMTPEEKLRKVFELSAFAKRLFFDGLQRRFPEKSEAELKRLYLERLEKCHNRNW